MSFDLLASDINKLEVFGAKLNFVLSQKLDNLSCVYASLGAFLNSVSNESNFPLSVVYNHEEIGSESRSGARGNFFDDVFHKFFYHRVEIVII